MLTRWGDQLNFVFLDPVGIYEGNGRYFLCLLIYRRNICGGSCTRIKKSFLIHVQIYYPVT